MHVQEFRKERGTRSLQPMVYYLDLGFSLLAERKKNPET